MKFVFMMPIARIVVVLLFLVGEPVAARDSGDALENLPASPGRFTVKNAFPGIQFFEPVLIREHPAFPGTFLVAERWGRIELLQKTADGFERKTFLDMRNEVSRTPLKEDGLLGFCFHPTLTDTAGKPQVFVFYTHMLNGQRVIRLSRLTLTDSLLEVQPGTQQVLIEQNKVSPVHNGGGLEFGQDGFLYVGVGDDGSGNDELQNSQRIDRNLFSGILRIDVDEQGGDVSHPIRRQPENGRTQHYFIPNGNPFAGEPNVLEEFWCLGLRNPWRFSMDSTSAGVWVGDVGQDKVEEINFVVAGSNCEWSFNDGNQPFPLSYLKGTPPEKLIGKRTSPRHIYDHEGLHNCVIGGFVYQGQRFPELHGSYLLGDCGSNRVWSLVRQPDGAWQRQELLSLPVGQGRLVSFGTDSQNEVYFCLLSGGVAAENGSIFTIADRIDLNVIPRRLSQTGLFTDVAKLQPHPELLPYEVNLSFWSDRAQKQRWLKLPAGTQLGYSDKGVWSTPVGTVLVKHFDLPTDERHPESMKRLETRVLVRTDESSVYGMTYRWNPEETDAELVTEPESVPVEWIDAIGRKHQQSWYFPSSADCLECHRQRAGSVLGICTPQWNRAITTSAGSVNQIQEWSRRGLLDRVPDVINPEECFARPEDETASVTHRVRSYLAVNCGHCHRAHTGIPAAFDATWDDNTSPVALEQVPLRKPMGKQFHKLLVPGNPETSALYRRLTSLEVHQRMPPIGHGVIDPDGEKLFRNWINSFGTEIPPRILAAAVEQTLPHQQKFIQRLTVDELDPETVRSLGSFQSDRYLKREGLTLPLAVSDQPADKAGLEFGRTLIGDFTVSAAYEIQQSGSLSASGAEMALSVEADSGLTYKLVKVIGQTLAEGECRVVKGIPAGGEAMLEKILATAPNEDQFGILRLRRMNETLHFEIENGQGERHTVAEITFPESSVRAIRILSVAVPGRSETTGRWNDVALMADQMYENRPAQLSSPTPFPPMWFWGAWVLEGVIVLAIARVLLHLRAETSLPHVLNEGKLS